MVLHGEAQKHVLRHNKTNKLIKQIKKLQKIRKQIALLGVFQGPCTLPICCILPVRVNKEEAELV